MSREAAVRYDTVSISPFVRYYGAGPCRDCPDSVPNLQAAFARTAVRGRVIRDR
jgi:hypothetical protein